MIRRESAPSQPWAVNFGWTTYVSTIKIHRIRWATLSYTSSSKTRMISRTWKCGPAFSNSHTLSCYGQSISWISPRKSTSQTLADIARVSHACTIGRRSFSTEISPWLRLCLTSASGVEGPSRFLNIRCWGLDKQHALKFISYQVEDKHAAKFSQLSISDPVPQEILNCQAIRLFREGQFIKEDW